MPRSCASPIILAIAIVAVRALLYGHLPALVTNDSWDYLQAAGVIFRDGDYFSEVLRDVRLPGYPTLLALTHPLTGLRSDGIVLLQAGCGLVSVALGWAIGALLGSRLVSMVMMAFLGLNPVFLLHEHAVMCEAFALTLYVGLVLAGLAGLRPTAGWPSWAALGAFLGVAMVTRANVLVLGATLATAACVLRPSGGGAAWSRAAVLQRLRPALVTAVVASVLVAPWLWRNWSAYGRPVVFASTNRNVVMYKRLQAPLDDTTPTLAMVNRTLGYDVVDYEWLWRLTRTYPSNEAEELAGRILAEQIAKHPWQHLRQIGNTVAGFFGWKRFHPDERTGMLFLFRVLVNDVPRMNALAVESPSAPQTRDWVYVPRDGDTPVTRGFARYGSLYLLPGRAIASIVFFGMLALYVARHATRQRPGARHVAVVTVLAAGYLATVAMHAVTLADYDRYATMFDFVAVLIAALIADGAVSRAAGAEPQGARYTS